MSAYIVEDKVINTLVSFICEHKDDHTKKCYYTLNPLRKKGFLSSTPKKLGKKMFDMNCQAVHARYPTADLREFGPLDYQFKPVSVFDHLNLYQVLKYLRCFLYQCSEGDIPDTSDLYAALDQVSGNLALMLIGDTPEYERCQWG